LNHFAATPDLAFNKQTLKNHLLSSTYLSNPSYLSSPIWRSLPEEVRILQTPQKVSTPYSQKVTKNMKYVHHPIQQR